jgi:hypothetical protein
MQNVLRVPARQLRTIGGGVKILESCGENLLVETWGSIEFAVGPRTLSDASRMWAGSACRLSPLPHSFQRAGTNPSMNVMSKNSPDMTSR